MGRPGHRRHGEVGNGGIVGFALVGLVGVVLLLAGATSLGAPGSGPLGAPGSGGSRGRAHQVPKDPTLHLVTRVVDGDTVELGNGRSVRLVGIDTPERGECGYDEASDHLADLVLGKRVLLRVSDEDTDRYGRLLRYVDIPVAGSRMGRVVDAGLDQIRSGFAIARYDSRDGYGFHPRQPEYVRSDRGTRDYGCSMPRPLSHHHAAGTCMAGYSPCLPVVADLDCSDIDRSVAVTGADPYRLDGDGDGTGCD